MDNLLANLSHYIPELMAIATMVGLLLIEATYRGEEGGGGRGFVFIGALIGLAFTLVALFLNMDLAPTRLFTNAVVIDPFSTLAKILMALGTAGAIVIAKESKEIDGHLKSEFIILSLGVLVGGMLLASAYNMLTVYLGVETLSILSYVMASLRKNDEHSSEAGLKYVLYGGVSAGLMLFGMGHIYGTLGTIQFFEMSAPLQELTTPQALILFPSFLLFFAGLGYKIACVPFHMWSPDVYEGSPTPVTAFFTIVPKIAGIVAITRVTLLFFGHEGSSSNSNEGGMLLQTWWVGVLQVIAALTMTVGNISAIGQKSIKRMLAYSSISHGGVMLLGVLVLDQMGVRAIIFYGITYIFMTLVAFFTMSLVANKYGNDHFERFSGLIREYPLMSVAMAIAMFSLAGLPPFSGFVAKFHIISVVIAKQYYTLAVITVLNSVVSLYYYMKIVRIMIFQEAESQEKIAGFNFLNQTIIIVLTVPIVVLGIFWEKILSLSSGAKILLVQ